jgi:hypothetical protein
LDIRGQIDGLGAVADTFDRHIDQVAGAYKSQQNSANKKYYRNSEIQSPDVIMRNHHDGDRRKRLFKKPAHGSHCGARKFDFFSHCRIFLILYQYVPYAIHRLFNLFIPIESADPYITLAA